MAKTVVITGAMGFIGSHTCKVFKKAGYRVVGIDREYTIPTATKFVDAFLKDDYVNVAAKIAVMENADAIIHLAATSLVGPSIKNPGEYYFNNVSKTNQMMEDLRTLKYTGKVIFSSSAAVYGNDYSRPIVETDRTTPVSPYGHSKLMCEQILKDHSYAGNIPCIALRYFNACGCDPDGDIGNTEDDSHLIPRIINKILTQERFVLNGNDFNTPDGTCIRDYLHVMDIAKAHLEAVCLAETLKPNEFRVYNLGTGVGYSNLSIIKACETVVGDLLRYKFGERREGDPDELIASPEAFLRDTSWAPLNSNLNTIIHTTYNWMKKLDINDGD